MKTIITQYFNTRFGELIIGSFDNRLCLADWRYRKMLAAIDKRLQENLNADYKNGKSNIIENTKIQLMGKPLPIWSFHENWVIKKLSGRLPELMVPIPFPLLFPAIV